MSGDPDLRFKFSRTHKPGGGGSSTPPKPIPPADLFFPLINCDTHEARVMTSSRADVMGGKINTNVRTPYTRFGVSAGARTASHEQFFPSCARYVNSLAMAKKYSLTREDLQNAKKQILANPHDTSGLDPRIMQWLQDSGFLGEQFFRGQLGFMRSLSGLDDDSGFVERIDFFGGHAAGEIMQALDHANAFYGMDMQVNGTEYTITCDGVKVLSGVYDEKNDVIYSKIEDDTPVENIDAALHTMIFMHCSSAASSDSNILTPEFSDNVLENIRALQIALYEAHMHILMDKNQLKLEMDKIDQLEKDSDITPKHAAALRKELQYIFDHCKTFLDKPQRDINGFREIMHYDYSSSGIASSARDTVQKFATKSTESAAIFDRAPWQPGARPAR